MKMEPKKPSSGKVLKMTLMQSLKAFRVYADLIKDTILLIIIIKALGGITLFHMGWTFAKTVSGQLKNAFSFN